MREDWKRSGALVALSDAEIQGLFRVTFPGARVRGTEIASGGLSNTHIKVSLDQFAEPMRLRLFHRGAQVAELERAVSQRVASDVPLPHCHHASSDGPDGRPYAIYSWVAGERLESVDLAPRDQREIARQLGAILAAIHQTRFERTGSVLCHGDFGASNLIVDEVEGRWQVVAVLDWEYACAGTPLGDLGNLLRPPFDTAEGFAQAVAEGYKSAGGALPSHWRDLALMTDLFAWIDFLGRDLLDDSVAASARSRFAYAMDTVRLEDRN